MRAQPERSEPKAGKPMIFVVGCPRSGTTLLRDLLRSHSSLTFPPETRFIPGFYRAYGDPANERAARRLARVILHFPWVRRWNPGLSPEEFASLRSYRGVIDRLFEEWARHEGKERWGDKTPGYALEIPTLVEIYPDAHFLHLIRDGRDVALSFMNAPFGSTNIYGAARQWRNVVRAGRRAGADLDPDAYLEVKYEVLVTEPERALRRICEFIDEPYDPRVLSPSRLGRDRKGHAPAPVSRDSIVADHCERWKRLMTARDVTLFETVAGDLLRELGYQVTGTPPSPIRRRSRLRWGVEDRVQRALNLLMSGNHRRNYTLLAWGRIRARLRSKRWVS